MINDISSDFNNLGNIRCVFFLNNKLFKESTFGKNEMVLLGFYNFLNFNSRVFIIRKNSKGITPS